MRPITPYCLGFLGLYFLSSACVGGDSGGTNPKDTGPMDFGIFKPDVPPSNDVPIGPLPDVAQTDSTSTEVIDSDVDGWSGDATLVDTFVPTETTCTDFCQTYVPTCSDAASTGVPSAYSSVEHCTSVCEGANWTAGTLDDTYKNTIGCRIRSLTNDQPSVACAAGAPDGGDTCGTACQNYCDLSQQLCPAEYESVPACKGQCASMNDDGIVGVALGDTVQCRLQVLIDFATTEGAVAESYCPNAGIATAGPCGLQPDCSSYCTEVMDACPVSSEYEQYSSVQACTMFCNQIGSLEVGSLSTDPENTVGCRMTAASLAKAAPALYCDRAGPSGDGHCGSWCVNYCALAMKTCTGEYQLFGSLDACLASCPTVGSKGEFGDNQGNSIQCRYTQLFGVAMGNLDKAQGCADAAVTSLDKCFNPPEPPTCDEYCTSILTACGGAGLPNSQYPDMASCLTYCDNEALFIEGTGSDKTGNTRGCRAYHASMASNSLDDPEAKAEYCRIAGPSGGNVCGELKANYCDLAMTQCINENTLYPSKENCLSVANALNALSLAPIETDDTLDCRFKQLAEGYMAEQKGLNCTEGSVYSKVCSGPINCFQYCVMVEAACGGEDQQHPYGDGANCGEFCEANPDKLGLPFEENVPTFGCRYTQAKIALKNSDGANCEAAGPTGGGLCGTACESYCDLAPVLCTGEFTLYLDKATCLQQCATLPQVADENAEYGNSVQCRQNALLAVYQGASGPVSCLEASFEGFEKCLEGVKPPAKTYQQDVQPILAQYCAPCHGVGSPEPGTCNGDACFVTHYGDLLEPSYYCPGKTKGECAVERISDGSMPLFGKGPNDLEIKLLKQWIQDGMVE